MGIKKTINVQVRADEAKVNIQRLNRDFAETSVEVENLEKKLQDLEKQLENTNGKTDEQINAGVKLFEQIRRTKEQIDLEKKSLIDINKQKVIERGHIEKATKARQVGTIKAVQFNETLLKNREISAGLSRVTGGLSTQVQQLGRLFISVGKGLKGFVLGLNTMKKALLATGIGAVAVGVGLLVANFDKIKAVITGTNPELEKLESSTEKIVENTNSEIGLLQKRKELLKLNGEETEDINRLLEEKFELQKANLLILLDELEAQLQIETERAKEVTLLEKIKTGLKFALNTEKGIAEALKSVSSENEKTSELQEKINKTRGQILDTDIKLAKLNKEATDEEEKQLKLLNQQFEAEQKLLLQKVQDQIGAEEEIGKIRRSFFKKNLEDQAALIEIEREEQLQRIKDSTANEFSKNLAIAEVNKFFDDQKLANEERLTQERLSRKQKENQEEERLEQEKRRIQNETFDNAVRLAGEDSKLGKAILVAKTILSAKENILRIKDSIANATKASTDAVLDGAKSGSAVARGAAETAKVGFPQNIPLLLAYAAQAVGVISAVKQAVGKTKQVASSVGGGAGISANIQAPSVSTSAPSFNIVGSDPQTQLAEAIGQQEQKPVKAFVVAGDVSTAQSLDRNIIQESSLG
tara:strand:+ start:869 stop:2791 length:1923 start_codon:yes stop_codon:yes gene_type:complete